MARDDGGPAFPVWKHGQHGAWTEGGMSLRDWFAGVVNLDGVEFPSLEAAAEYAGVEMPSVPTAESSLAIGAAANAKLRYMLADALLAARGEKGECEEVK